MSGLPDVVMWLDPGKTTGAAWWIDPTAVFGSGEYDAEGVDLLLRLTAGKYPGEKLAVGCEGYNVTSGGPRTGTPEHSLKVIGLVEQLAVELGFTLLKQVPSSQRKLGLLWSRRMGWRKRGKRHANDAAAHLLTWLMARKPMPSFVREKLFPDRR